MTHGEHEIIRGEVIETRVLGHDFWGKTRIRVSLGGQRTEEVAVMGKILGFQAGDTVEVEGQWDRHPRFGRQFRAVSISTIYPQDASGVISWLAAYLPGFGRKRAAELVERFGVPGIWTVIENEPARLAEVRGITLERVAQITEAYAAHRAERDRMVHFRQWGLTDTQVARVLAAWGERAEERIQADPYALIELDRIGFRIADSIALRMGLARTAPERVRAGALHTLGEAAAAGHVFVHAPKLVKITAKLLEVCDDNVRPHVRGLDHTIQRETRVYLRRYDAAEARVARRIVRLAGLGTWSSAWLRTRRTRCV